MACNYNAARWILYRSMIMGDRGFQYADKRKVCNKLDSLGEDHFQKTGCSCYIDLRKEANDRVLPDRTDAGTSGAGKP